MIIALSIFLGLHFYVYYSLVRFFTIVSAPAKIELALVLLFLALSFFAASALSRHYDGAWMRTLYFASSVWLGFLFYLIIGLSLLWGIFWLGNFFHYNPNFKILTVIVFFVVSFVSGYGILKAREIKIKEIAVRLKNLPAGWSGEKAVFVSDLHLGAINGAEYSGKIVKKINELNPRAVFIGGDYFDDTSPKLNELAAPLSGLRAPDGVYFISGNHEAYLGLDKVKSSLAGIGVKYLADESVDLSGLNIIGVNYPFWGAGANIDSVLSRVNRNEANILLYHEPRYIKKAQAAGINLQLAGHTHDGQLWPFNLFTRIIYGKYSYGLNHAGDYNVYTSSGAGTWGPPLRVGSNSEIVVIKFE